MKTEFVVILGRAWMNDRGHGVNHSWDGLLVGNIPVAIAHGFEVAKSDDFNVGRVEDGRLVDVLWMDKSRGDSARDIALIAAETGLTGEHKHSAVCIGGFSWPDCLGSRQP